MGSSKKVYKRILRPAIMYDLETVALTGRQEAKLEVEAHGSDLVGQE